MIGYSIGEYEGLLLVLINLIALILTSMPCLYAHPLLASLTSYKDRTSYKDSKLVNALYIP